MAYNPNKAADVAELKTELTTDPVVMGYNTTKVKQTASKLNTVGDNTSPTTVQRGWPDIQVWEIWDAGYDETEYAALTGLDKVKADSMYSQDPEQSLSSFRIMLRNAFGATSTTYATNLTGLRTVDASRADVLWGYGSNITKDNVKAALES